MLIHREGGFMLHVKGFYVAAAALLATTSVALGQPQPPAPPSPMPAVLRDLKATVATG